VNTRHSSPTRSFGGELLIAVTFGWACTIIAYVAVRLLDVALFPEPNPVVVIWTDRSRFLWRALIATYLGGAGAFAGFGVVSRAPQRAHVWLARVILAAGGCLLVQTIVAP
jgi:hypothetical protein